MKTHKLLVKNKLFTTLTKEEATIYFEKLMKTELKIKIHDKENNIFLNPYINDVVLDKLDDLEIVIENSGLSNRKKQEVYYIVKKREDERQKLTEKVIQNIIDEVMTLD